MQMITEFTEKTGLTFVSSGQDTFHRACDILKISQDDRHDLDLASEFLQEEPKIHLVLLHHKEDCSNKNVYHVRGTCVDLIHNVVLADSYGKTPSVVEHELLVDEYGCLLFQDEENNGYTFYMSDESTEIVPFFEGVVIRFIWHQSKLFSMTHRKINPIKSRWGNSKFFLDTFTSIVGDKFEEKLFDCTKPYSNTCYHFLLVEPDLLVATKQIVNQPYIVYVGAKLMVAESDDWCRGVPSFPTESMNDYPLMEMNQPAIYNAPKMDITSAELFLNKGYFPTFTFRENVVANIGEALLITQKDAQGNVLESIKVQSSAYKWRCDLRENNSNVAHQFYALLGRLYNIQDETQFIKMFEEKGFFHFSAVNFYNVEETVKSPSRPYLFSFPETKTPSYKTNALRISAIFINFFLSLPYHIQPKAFDVLKSFFSDRTELCQYMIQIQKQKERDGTLYGEDKKLSPRFQAIIKNATTAAYRESHQRNIYDNSYLIEQNITNIISTENGTSLYKMIREMKKNKKMQC